MNDSASSSPSSPDPASPRFTVKDWAIALLGVLVLALGGLVVADRLPDSPAGPDEELVSIFDTVLDRQQRSYIDLLFDRPLGEGQVGEVLVNPPATITPAVGGSWRWRDGAVLRFEPSGRLDIATEYVIALIPERLLGPGQKLAGDGEVRVRTDQFLVESADFYEEPAFDAGRGAVVLRGELRFNYAVDPDELAGKLRLLAAGGDEVEVLYESTYPSTVIGLRSQPVTKVKQEQTLRLIVEGSLTPSSGNVTLPGEFVHQIPLGSIERLAVRKVTAEPGAEESTVRLTFTSLVSAEAAARQIALEPPVAVRASAQRNQVLLTGPFELGRQYKVTAQAGLAASDGAVLAADFSSMVSLPDLSPRVGFEAEGRFLSASGSRAVGVVTVNVDRFELVVERVYRNNLFSLFQYQSYLLGSQGYGGGRIQQALGDRLHMETVRVSGARNREVVTPVELGPIVERGGPGFYRVAVRRPKEYQAEQRWLLVTDLGVVAKLGEARDVDGRRLGDLTAWVFSFDDLAPAVGARVTVISDQNQQLGEGRTDAQGRFRLGASALAAGEPYMITVDRGGDSTFLLLDDAAVDLAGLEVGGAPPRGEGYEAYIYGERDLYRPGEEVEGVAIVRDQRLRPAPEMPLTLTHRDPEGRERGSQRLTVGPQGTAAFQLELPPYARTGNHSLALVAGGSTVGRYRFQVEEFIPDRIKVAIDPSAGRPDGAAGPPGPGEELSYQVAASYLFGPPASGLAVASRVRLEPLAFRPAGYAAYSFENPERDLTGLEILDRSGELDGAGEATFSALVPAGLTAPSALSAVITARVQERGGRGVTAVLRQPVHPVERYVGLRRVGEGYAEPEQEVRFEWVALAPTVGGADEPLAMGGEPATAGALRAELIQDRWNTVLRRAPSGGFRYDSVREPRVVASEAIAAGQQSGSFTLVPPDYGSYRVVISDLASGASAQVSFYAAGWGYSPWAIESPGKVEIDLDRASYAPGEAAQVQVKSPFPGKLLLTVERDGVLSSEVHQLTGNTATFSLPVAESYRPNVYVTAMVLRPAGEIEPGAPGRAFGAVPLAVDRESKRLPVTIAAPGEVRPDRPLTVAVETDPGAVLTVAAVDEGILQLIGQRTADPFSYFYRKLALGVRSFDSFGLLMPDSSVPPAGGGVAAKGGEQFVSTESMRRVAPVAFFSGLLTAGADGRVETTFELPQFQGRLRLMAVAVEGDRFGSGEEAVRVRDRLVLLPTLPRYLQPGDRFELPLTLRNDTGADGSFRVRVEAEGPVSLGGESGDGTLTLEVANGAEATGYLPVAVQDAIGVVRFRFVAEGGGERTRDQAELPVRSHLPRISRVAAGSLAEAAVSFPVEGDYMSGTLQREIALGPVPVVHLAGQLSDLLRYPYGCLEQTVSRTMPLVYLGPLARQLEPELFAEAEPEVLVEQGIRRLTTLQLGNGGFAMWPDGRTAQPWGSLYATHLLIEARQAGHDVPYFLHDGALDYAASLISAKPVYGGDELDRVTYALYVLARAGRADRGSMDFLRQRHRDALSPHARALLAAASAAAGEPAAVAELIAGIADVEEVERQTGGNFSSTRRNRALLLTALLDAAPDDPRIAGLADRIARDASAGLAWTTQESAFSFLALGRLFQRAEQLDPVAGGITVGGRPVGPFSETPAAYGGIPGTEPLAVAVEEGFEPNRLYYQLVERGVPTAASYRPAGAGLEVERAFLDRDGKPADLAGIAQGDLLVLRTRVRSVSGAVDNVVVVSLLPPGLEVENPRLESTESLPWVTDAGLAPDHLDLRDDRILAFADLPANSWQTLYTLVRAVTPGTFSLPPVTAEAMYNPALSARGETGVVTVSIP